MMKIGVFDSGLGGLSVLRRLRQRFPEHDLVYYGDTAHAPYGKKSGDMIAAATATGIDRLVELGARLIVVTCHSAAAWLTEAHRTSWPVPILDILREGVVPAASTQRAAAVGIIGPPAVGAAGAHAAAIGRILPDARVYFSACPLVHSLVETGWMKKPETAMIVKKNLLPLKVRQIDMLVVASHHLWLLNAFVRRKMGRRVSLADAAGALSHGVAHYLERHCREETPKDTAGSCRVLVSDIPPGMEKTAALFLGGRVKLEL